MEFLHSILTFDKAAISTFVLLVLSWFVEIYFDKKFVGRYVFGAGWKALKFFGNWFCMPFRPQITQFTEIFIFARELKPIVTGHFEEQKKQTEEFMNNLEFVRKELTVNSGESVKDRIVSLNENLTQTGLILSSLVSSSAIINLRLDIADEADNRMSFLLDENLSCTKISDNFLRRFGYAPRDVIGLDWDFCYPKRNLRQIRAAWREARTKKSQFRETHIIVDSDGREHRCLVRGFPLVESGELNGFYGTIEILEEES